MIIQRGELSSPLPAARISSRRSGQTRTTGARVNSLQKSSGRPRVHFVFGLRLRQLSPLTHRTSIRFCTQSCGENKKEGAAAGAPPGTSQSASPIDRRRLLLPIAFQIRARSAVLKDLSDSESVASCAACVKPFVIAHICCDLSARGILRLMPTLNDSP